MKISARTRYGLRILLDVAMHAQDEAPRTISAIAQSQAITPAFVSRLAVPLKRAGLIRSLRGISGGLRLAKSPDDISLLAITEALDGPVSILTCLSKPKTCKRHRNCPARTIWGDLNLTIRGALSAITLSSVMRRLGLRHDDADYCI